MKLKIRMLVFCMLFLLVTACGKKQKATKDPMEYHVDYINSETTRIVEKAYDPKETETRPMIQEFLGQLSKDSNSINYQKAIPDKVKVLKFNLEGGQLSLYFNKEYKKMKASEEVLRRAAIVRTMMEIKGVECVSFYVGDAPLSDARDNLVGIMNEDSFVENPGKQINTIQQADLKLYFANKRGDGLVKVSRTVHYSSNIAMEKLVVEQLLDGPKTEGLRPTIPESTNIVGVTATDGVCYVNLDEGFLNQDYTVSEEVVMYSIINSLTELPNVSRVQISINGRTKGVYRDKMELNTLYEQNLDCVTTYREGRKTSASKK